MVEDDAVRLLCDLFAASCRSFEPSALPAKWQGALAFLRKIGAVQNGGLPSVVTCGACDDNHAAGLEYDPEAQRYWHFCPEAGRVDVADASLETLRADREWVVGWLVKALPIAPDRHRALVADSIWSLGDTSVGQAEISIVFAARASTGGDLRTLADAIRTVHPAKLGLVITARAPLSSSLSLPNQFHILDLREIARVENDQLVIDRMRFDGWVKGYGRGQNKPVRDRPGRPTRKDLVLEIARERRERKSALPVLTAEARAIREEFIRRYPRVGPPAASTIRDHHLPEME